MPDIYIDPSASANGSGTAASPYNSFTEIRTWNSDRGGDWAYIKGGTTIRSHLYTGALASNYNIGAYGGGDKPVIKASTLGVWLQEGSLWYAASMVRKNNVFLNATPLLYVTLKASLTLNTAWFDSPNSRIYISVTDNPNSAGVEIATIINAVSVYSPKIVRDIKAMHGYDTSFQLLQAVNDVQIISVDAEWGGSPTGINGRNCFEIKGVIAVPPAAVTYATNVRVRYCTAKGGENNSFEIWHLDGAEFSDNYTYGSFSNEYEIWQYVKNSTFQRNRGNALGLDYRTRSTHFMRFFGNDNVIDFPGGNGAYGVNVGNTVKNCRAKGTLLSADPVIVEGGSNNNKFYHNTLIDYGTNSDASYETSGISALAVNAVACTGTEFKNNIVFTYKPSIFLNSSVGSAIASDGNVWFSTGKAFPIFSPQGAYQTSIGAYNATAEVGTDQWANPVLVSDYSITLASPAVSGGVAGLVETDINKLVRLGNMDSGCEQYRDLVKYSGITSIGNHYWPDM